MHKEQKNKYSNNCYQIWNVGNNIWSCIQLSWFRWHWPEITSLFQYNFNHGRLARCRKWRACDEGEAKEGLENELWRSWSSAHSPTFPSLHLRHNSFSNPSVALPTSQLILQPFRCFTYVTAHSPTLLPLLLIHRLFTYVTWRAAHVPLWIKLCQKYGTVTITLDPSLVIIGWQESDFDPCIWLPARRCSPYIHLEPLVTFDCSKTLKHDGKPVALDLSCSRLSAKQSSPRGKHCCVPGVTRGGGGLTAKLGYMGITFVLDLSYNLKTISRC